MPTLLYSLRGWCTPGNKVGAVERDRIPSILEENCVGCNLCALVCPVANCITMVRKDDGKNSATWKARSEEGNIPTTFNDELAGGKAHHIPEPNEALHKKNDQSK